MPEGKHHKHLQRALERYMCSDEQKLYFYFVLGRSQRILSKSPGRPCKTRTSENRQLTFHLLDSTSLDSSSYQSKIIRAKGNKIICTGKECGSSLHGVYIVLASVSQARSFKFVEECACVGTMSRLLWERRENLRFWCLLILELVYRY